MVDVTQDTISISEFKATCLAVLERVRRTGRPPRHPCLDLEPARAGKARPRATPFTFEVARESRRIRLPHQDPADRFLAATARVHGLILVTADERLLAADGYQVMPNR